MSTIFRERGALIAILQIVEPALSENTLIPVLTHFWFLGDRVMAFNDKIAISTPLVTDFKGAAPGEVMLELLKATHAREIKFEQADNSLVIRAGKVKDRKDRYNYKWNLGLLAPSNFIFEMPKPPDKTRDGASFKQFFDGLENCMRSVTSDTTVPDQLGITLIPSRKGQTLELYSTNDATMSHAVVDKGLWTDDRVILSGEFCEQALPLRRAEKIGIEIRDDHVIMQADETILFGRIIDSPQPVDFPRLLKEHLPDKGVKFSRHPAYLEGALDRACIITESTVSVTKTSVSIENGRCKLHSKSDRGVVDDSLKMLDQHEPVTTSLNPRLVKDGLEFPELLLTGECLIMRKGDLYYFVAANE